VKSHGKQPNRQLTSHSDRPQSGQHQSEQENQESTLPLLKSSFLFISLVFVASVVAWSAVMIREPLWIDELHTLWSIQGDWQDVLTRSNAGNQSPLYFYFLKAYVEVVQLLLRSFGLDSMSSLEMILRSFSLIGWGLVAWLMSTQISSFRSRSEPGVMKTKPMALATGFDNATIFSIVPEASAYDSGTKRFASLTCEPTLNGGRSKLIAIFFVGGLWLMSDRTGGFYATEARPYVWVAVACVLMITKTIPTVGSSWRWLMYGVAAFYLHYTAIVMVAASFLLRSVALYRNVSRRRLILYEAFVLALVMTPGLLHLAWLGKSSSQWAYFAGGSDLFTVLRILPWFAWVVMTAVLVELARGFRWSDRMTVIEESLLLQTVLWLAFIGMGTYWSLCYLGWAPLMHSRYLIGIYPAIWIAGILLLKRLNDVRWIIAVGLLAMGAQGWLQGSWPLWGRGEWIAWQRIEDWDKAFEVLQHHKQAGDVLFFAPFLIETEDQQIIDTSAVTRKRYFAFPIESLSIASGQVAPEPVIVIANSISQWESTIEGNFERMNYDQKSGWLLARTSQPWTIATASDSKFSRELLYQAGNLQLWRLQLGK
jgi:mannosyltransferase